ncbi:MBL fold metallo-hydrolase [Alphaproteobacteria bacterium]|nr:MBL fold metallo-hydrolase [Alphaproteobacteria bacterium]
MLKLHQKDRCFTLLFDTGPEEGLVIENAKRMGVDLKQVDAIVISHGHFDHYGGTLSVLKEIGKKDLPVYAHPEVFLPRAFKKKKLITISHLITPKDVEKAGGKVITSRDATPLWEDSVILTGEVPRKTAYEQGAPGEHRLVEGCWESTPDIIDERCLVFELEGKGLCVLTGCGHTGVVNAARHAIETTGKEKIHMKIFVLPKSKALSLALDSSLKYPCKKVSGNRMISENEALLHTNSIVFNACSIDVAGGP